MLDANTLIPIFADKLMRTGSFDKALYKIAWMAYKQGLADAAQPPILPKDHFSGTTLPSDPSTSGVLDD